MSNAELDFKELEAYSAELLDAVNKFPGTAEKHLRSAGNQFKKMLISKSPNSGSEHKRKLIKSWHSEIKGYTGSELSCDIYSTAPHFHLVNRGHVLKNQRGQTIGFVQGQHFLEAAAQEVETDILPNEWEKLLKDITKKLGD